MENAGLHEEEVNHLAARQFGRQPLPSISWNIGTKLDKTVAIFSLEMGAEGLVDRMLASSDSHSLQGN